MKKLILVPLCLMIIGCEKDKPHTLYTGGFVSMENCIRDVKVRSGHTPEVTGMSDTKVSGKFDGMKMSQGLWSCSMEKNQTGLPFYGVFSIEN